MLLRQLTVSAEDAFAIGLADQVVDDAELSRAAQELARELAAGPTLAMGLTKQMLLASGEPSLERFLDQEVLVQSVLVRGDDHREGVAALSQRRQPHFRGR